MDEQNKDSELNENSDHGNVIEEQAQTKLTPEQQFNPQISPIAAAFIGLIGGFFLYQIVGGLLTPLFFYSDVTKFLRIKIPNWKEVLLFTIGIAILTVLLQNYLYIQNYFIDQLANSVPLIKTIKELLDTLNAYVEKTYGSLLKANSVYE